ncbi:ATP-grasp domain-containing protein [Bacteriovoracaceae bacterium]|nr:ATP-grasp domain-containing protein [Bacteriovoracaceae bacterium]
MNKRILICNRGEIAIRIAKAVSELGGTAIGFYTDFEKEPAHLEYCQEWIYLSGTTNLETYLNQDKIIELAQKSKADAIHPGYGFLSENPSFADKVKETGIIFIGPHAQAIHSMGDKAVSKKIAKDAGVPVVPGSVGKIDTINEAKDIAKNIAYPVLLKAVAGGGGKGMRVCNNDEELEKFFPAVQREAKSSFGNPDLLVEKYIVNPHHIEVQILANNKGDVFHLYERECSIQRRHQKVIEEAPSPFIGSDEKTRQNICETAVKLARHVQYDSAGTVEFIMGEDKSFYFLEMNTRIQVEHPITEEITNIDLMVNMIKSAFDMDLDFKSQEDIQIRGHAIELRICAEDSETMLPSPGMIENYDYELGKGIRFDHCLRPNREISSNFDPMVGKLVARGFDRSVAIRKVRNALNKLNILGLKTNIPLLKVILAEETFQAGQYTTFYIDKIKPQENLNLNITPQELLIHAIEKEIGLTN